MPRPDAIAELRQARPAAAPALRERVQKIAAAGSPPPRRLTWRRAGLVLAPAVLAVAVGAAVVGRHGGTPAADRAAEVVRGVPGSVPEKGFGAKAAPATAVAPAPSATRAQDYDATLRLRVPTAEALSNATKRAVRIAGSLGGFASVVDVAVEGGRGAALLRLRVPVTKVQVALQRLSELGTITGESVRVHDLKPQLDAGARRIARLQAQLQALRANAATPALRIAALTAQIERLQRARAGTLRQARLATISVELATPPPAAAKPHRHGPLHGALTALKWLGIGALYAAIVGGPVAALVALLWVGRRRFRRSAERRLLERV